MPKLPPKDLKVDFGQPCLGTANPMSPTRRREYEERIRAGLGTGGVRLVPREFRRDSSGSRWPEMGVVGRVEEGQ